MPALKSKEEYEGYSMEFYEFTPEEIKKEIEKEKEERAYYIDNSVPLKCDLCEKSIGFVFESDLNGSKFYCKKCKDKKDLKPIRPIKTMQKVIYKFTK